MSKRAGAIGVSEADRNAEYQSDAERGALDATRGYGYFARDNGKFGSHPSHDGFDDNAWA